MADPFRLRVIKGLTAVLETPIDSNDIDLTNEVFRGRLLFGEDDPLPCATIIEPPIPIDLLPPPEEAPYNAGEWQLTVQGFVKDDKNHPLDPAYILSAQLIAKLANERARPARERREFGTVRTPLFGVEGVTDLLIGAPVHRPADNEVSNKAYCYIGITLKYAENLANPY